MTQTPPPQARGLSGPRSVRVRWPNGRTTAVPVGSDWLVCAREAGVSIPTGCLGGSCGACEIEVNGEVVRACIASVPSSPSSDLQVELAADPYW